MTSLILSSSSSSRRSLLLFSVGFYTFHSLSSDNVKLIHLTCTYADVTARVIAEVIGGILLGPTALGRIPNFTATIFPAAAMPNFNLVANLGLILFLFIVGLEVDLRIVRKNARVAISVGTASLVVPFAFGCLIAWVLFREYSSTLTKANFGVFLLFIGTAFSITAFPVLARILTELKLLRTDVGVTVLSAGVGNDVVGWILLALTIALVNASSGLTAFYVILLVVAWTLILFFLVKPAYRWCIKRSSMTNSPSNSMMTLTLLLVLVSSFYTEIIGVHPIFGAFLIGMIVPHDDGYAVSLAEKIEDLISVLFLPLYFASSGLKTNIGLLNDGKAWGYTILIIFAATFSKISGSMLAARLNGFLWRESSTVGILMSCKGLVELIVLNVGLSAGILSQKLFTMFVIMALVTTFMTTPITVWFYPQKYQIKVARWRAGEIDWEGNVLVTEADDESDKDVRGMTKLAVVVNRVESVAPLLQFTHFITSAGTRLHLVRTLEMTDRLSQLIMVSETADMIEADPLISIFRTYGQLLGVRLSYALQTLDPWAFSNYVASEANSINSDMLIVPWIQDPSGGMAGNDYVTSLLELRSTNLAVLIDSSKSSTIPGLKRRTMSMSSIAVVAPAQRKGPTEDKGQRTVPAEKSHMYFPIFQYGPDERLALQMIEQFMLNDKVTISVVFFKTSVVSGPSVQAHSTDKAHIGSIPHPRDVSVSAVSYTSSMDDIESEILQVQERVPTHLNLTFEINQCSDVLQSAISRMSSESQKGSMTVVLANSTRESTKTNILEMDKSELASSYGSCNRGEVVEVFAATKDRECKICVVSARHEAQA